ncbi:MAG TPA: class I SAM-dependent methyltransferase [Bacillota bacterium]|mgnify:CR=1 FL=1|nr:class I SAM-dependent methyltransferase [Bacillota bacterium]
MEKNIDFGHVADIYDYYANADIDIDFFKMLCKGHKNILELMCGTGRLSKPLIEAGFPLTCVDYSEEMLEVLRKKIGVSEAGPQAASEAVSQEAPNGRLQNVEIVCQDVCEMDLGKRFDLIIIPSNSIAEIIDQEKRRQAFRRIYKHLTSDGIFFCTLYNPPYRIKQADGNIRYLGKYDLEDGRTLFITYYNVYSSAARLITGTQFYEIYDHNRLVEKRCLDIRFSVISKEEICKMAHEEGFTLKAIYGDYTPYHYDEASTHMNLLFQKKRR